MWKIVGASKVSVIYIYIYIYIDYSNFFWDFKSVPDRFE